MKRSRLAEEQIIGVLKEHQAGLGAAELSSERRRFGHRRLPILREREGWKVKWKKPCSI